MNRKTLCSTRKMTREGLNWELWVQKWTLEGSLTTFFSFTGTHGTRAVFTFRRIKKYQYVERDKANEHTNINHGNEESYLHKVCPDWPSAASRFDLVINKTRTIFFGRWWSHLGFDPIHRKWNVVFLSLTTIIWAALYVYVIGLTRGRLWRSP